MISKYSMSEFAEVIIDQSVPGVTNGVVIVSGGSGGGGLSAYRNLDLGVTGQVVKSSAGTFNGYYLANQASSFRYVKIYNKATAPTAGDTPVFTYALPPNSAGHRSLPLGVTFASGISLRATTGVADADTGAPATNDVVVNIEYN